MTKSDFTDELTQPPTDALAAGARPCPQCGLEVPAELDCCPNDGTSVAKSPQEQLSNRYEFQELIGKGGMSVIYKARHKLMDSTVAIKLLQEKLTQDKSSFMRFRQEAQTSSRLDHANVIKVLDFGVLDSGAAYLVMDFIEGRSLADVIAAEGQLDPERALSLFTQICEGLVHAHQNGVLHRDLKPSNVLVTQDANGIERVKIVDFGIAKMLAPEGAAEANKLTSTGEVFGSPLYMSPEQCMGIDVDARSDIYSMGCLMYETVCGKPPLLGSNPIETIFKQMNERPEPVTAHVKHPLAAQLSRVILRALEKDRAHRYQKFEDMIEDLHKVRHGQKIKVRRRMPVFKLAAAGVMIAGACIYFAMQPSHRIPNEVIHHVTRKDGILYWQENKATDADCTTLAKYPVVRLELRGNEKLTTVGLSKFLEVPTIEQIYIDGTSADDEFLRKLAASPLKHSLKKLSIGRTKITPDGFASLTGFYDLDELALLDMNLQDTDLAKLPTLPIKRLKLDWNPKITDRGVSIALPKFPRLNEITLRKTGVTNATIDAIQQAFPTDDKDFKISAWGSNIDRELKPKNGLKVNINYVKPWWADPLKGGLEDKSEEQRLEKEKHKMLRKRQNES